MTKDNVTVIILLVMLIGTFLFTLGFFWVAKYFCNNEKGDDDDDIELDELSMQPRQRHTCLKEECNTAE